MVRHLTGLIVREYPGMAFSTAYVRISKAIGVSLSTMQRIMSGTTGPSIDTLADLARHLGTTVPAILDEREIGAKEFPFPKTPEGRRGPQPVDS